MVSYIPIKAKQLFVWPLEMKRRTIRNVVVAAVGVASIFLTSFPGPLLRLVKGEI